MLRKLLLGKILYNFLYIFIISILFAPSNICYSLGILIPDSDYIPIESRIRPYQPPQIQNTLFGVQLSLKKLDVKIEVNDFVAKTTVEHIFYNDSGNTIEGLFIFPLPIDSVISNFAMEIDGKMVRGELLDATKANEIYQSIVRKFQDPALLEFHNNGLFRIRIFPIEPYKERKIRLEYQQSLKYDANLVRLLYPLRMAKVFRNPILDVSIAVKISSSRPLANIYSPTHKLEIKRYDNKNALISFESKNYTTDDDLVLYYGFSNKELSLSILAHKPNVEEGSFLMLLAPSFKMNINQKKQRINLGLVIDVSGSMAGDKLAQAKSALEFCIKALPEENYLYLLSFATDVNACMDIPMVASSNVKSKALEFIKNLEALGGTNINDALITAINAMNKLNNNYSSYILFVTDGKPTVGVVNDVEILKNIKDKNNKNIKIFVLGVGSELNSVLLDSIASENNGVVEYISENEHIEVKISSLYSKLINPVLTNPKIYIEGVNVSQIYPQKIPDIFSDSSITISGLYKNGGKGKVKLTGQIEDQNVDYVYDIELPVISYENEFVGKIWAMRKIGYLLEQIRKYGSNEEIKNDIVTLSKKYGVLTPYTAYLVLEDNLPNPNVTYTPRVSPVPPVPHYPYESNKPYIIYRFDVHSKYKDKGFELENLRHLREGEEAVKTSIDVNALKSADVVDLNYKYNNEDLVKIRSALGIKTSKPELKTVADKIFYNSDGKWIDITVDKTESKLVIKAFSTAYFELLKIMPEIAKYLSLGSKIIINFKGRVLEISTEEGIKDVGELLNSINRQ